MKCKAAVSGLKQECVYALNRLRPRILCDVVGPILKRPTISCAEFYVQECDVADCDTHKPFCEVRLSGVSITDDRAVQDFHDALEKLEQIYEETLREHLMAGQVVQLFVVMMLDAPPKPGMSTIIECPVKTVSLMPASV